MVTLLTPTCDQPIGFALCEEWMRRQTVPLASLQWIVVDDGVEPIRPTCGQDYIRRVRGTESGAQSLCANLLAALPFILGDRILCIEHDDHYASTHLDRMLDALESADLVGDDGQRYYHVGQRVWRAMQNRGASLCQTGFRRELLPAFELSIRACADRNRFGVDEYFWRHVDGRRYGFGTVVGIKGLPGRPGLGIGHRPRGSAWTADPDGAVLRSWIGADAARYDSFALPRPHAV